MTNEEIQKLMEFIITQQAQITTNQAEITLKQLAFENRQEDFEKKQAQIMDIHFETAKRQAEFEIRFDNKLSALLDNQAETDKRIRELTEDMKYVHKRMDKLEDNKS